MDEIALTNKGKVRAAAVTPVSAVLPALSATDPAALSYAGLLDALATWHKRGAWVAAQQHRVLAALAHAAPVPVHRDSAALREWDRQQEGVLPPPEKA